jgi:polyphosphate:AMP phosphotransferase
MFDTAELGRSLDKAAYDAQVPELRTGLLKAQKALAEARFPVMVLLHGMDAAGRGEVLNLLHEWLDARYLDRQVYEAPTEEERQRPEYWRYWQWLPPHGRIGLFLGSWYSAPLLLRAHGKCGSKTYLRSLQQAGAFESMLAEDGALFVKLWLHISKAEQKRRLEAFRKQGAERFRIQKHDFKRHARYDEFTSAAARMIRETSTARAPWTVVEATDERYRNVTVARCLIDRIHHHLELTPNKAVTAAHDAHVADPITILDTLDLRKRLSDEEYSARRDAAHAELNRLATRLYKRKRSAILVFEGWDAAGKGGAIRRITRALDARQYRVISTAAPNDEERAHHYLWRFWRHLPRRGRITIYDRSWYGRVLVERVEGFASEAEWKRAYYEINDFEEQLVRDGSIVLKFWLHVSAEEQLQRFRARAAEPFKQYKLTEEDFRNRERSHLYESAVNDMLGATDTEYAPWVLVEAENKQFARVKVLESLCHKLARAL